MDSLTPVANQVQYPDFLKSYQNVLGIQQAKQNLAAGQLGLQKAQQDIDTGSLIQQQERQKATAAQQTQAEQQLTMKMAQSGQDPDGNSLKDPNTGEWDLDSLDRARTKWLPLTGANFMQSAIKTRADKTGLNQSLLDLDMNTRNAFSGIIGSFRGQDGVTSKQIRTAVDSFIAKDPTDPNSKDKPDRLPTGHYLNNLLEHFDSAPDKDAFLARLQNEMTAPNNVYSSTRRNTHEYTTASGDVGALQTDANGQVVNKGTVATQGLGPTLSQNTGANQIVKGGGGSGGVVGAHGGGPAPTTSDIQRHADYETDLNNRVRVGSQNMPIINAIEEASKAISQGGGAGSKRREEFAKTAQSLGAPQNVVDAIAGGNLGELQALQKELFQTTLGGLKTAMGSDQSHVAQFNAANSVFPDIDTDPRARGRVLSYLRDSYQRDYAEQQALAAARRSGTFNPVTWQADYQAQLRGGKVPNSPSTQNPTPRTVVRTGMIGNKKVVQYSDGTLEYAK